MPRTVRYRPVRRILACAPGLLLLAACARPVPVHLPSPSAVEPRQIMAAFQQQIHDGCYLCLRDVLQRYAALDGRMRQVPRIRRLAARAALFFILRDKALGIPVGHTWAEAQALAAAEAQRSAAYRFDLQVAHVLPWNELGVDPDFADAQRHLHPVPATATLNGWRRELAANAQTDETAAYLALSMNCEFPLRTPIAMAAIHQHYQSEPLIQYRWATCAQGGGAVMAALLQQDPRFAEIHYFMAQRAFQQRRFDRAQQEYLEAWQGIPHFTAAGLAYGDLALSVEEFATTLRVDDAVLAIVPNHRRAMLSRIIALSNLGRYKDAAAGASRLITLGNWYLGDAYYWRAFAEYHLHQLASALVDVNAAKHSMVEARVYVLAGLIRMSGRQWRQAKPELLQALRINPGRCDAMFYLGQTDGGLGTWPAAAASFGRAVACFEGSERGLEANIAALTRETGAYAARMLARRRAELAQTVRQKASALFDTAVSYASAGDRRRALQYAARARVFPAYAARVKALVARIRRQ